MQQNFSEKNSSLKRQMVAALVKTRIVSGAGVLASWRLGAMTPLYAYP
jgi:hypothetical protein